MKKLLYIALLFQGILFSLISLGIEKKIDSEVALYELDDFFDVEEDDFSETDDPLELFKLKYAGGGAILPTFDFKARFKQNVSREEEIIREQTKCFSKTPLFLLNCSLKVDC